MWEVGALRHARLQASHAPSRLCACLSPHLHRDCFDASNQYDILLLAEGQSYPSLNVTIPLIIAGQAESLVVFTNTVLNAGLESSPVLGTVSISSITFQGAPDLNVWADTLSLIQCVFVSSSATNAMVFAKQPTRLIIDGSTFTTSSVGAIGGVAATELDVHDSVFNDITSTSAIRLTSSGSTITIINSTFDSIISSSNGAAIDLQNADLFVNSSLFFNCQVSPAGYGGAIMMYLSSAVLFDNVFTQNDAFKGASLYHYGGNLQSKFNAFSKNSAIDEGCIVSDAAVSIAYAFDVFCINKAGANPDTVPASEAAECVSNGGCTVDADECCPAGQVVDRTNSSHVTCKPVAVYASESGVGDCLSVGSPCSLATAYSTVARDGTIHLAADTFTTGLTLLKPVNIKGTDGTIFEAVTIQVGDTDNKLTSLSIENIIFQNAADMNILLAAETVTLTLSNVVFDNCGSAGAAFLQTAGKLFLERCQFLNGARRGIFLASGVTNQHLEMRNSTFMNLATGGAGGGIFTTGASCSVKIANSSFIGVSSASGGALYVADGVLEIDRCLFSGCSATSSLGGSIYRSGSDSAIVSRSIFVNCHAASLGGVVYAASAPGMKILSSVFTSNHADEEGGALWMNVGSAILSDSQFCLNTAGISDSDVIPSTLISGCGDCSFDADDCCPDPLQAPARLNSSHVACDCILKAVGGSCVTECPSDEYDFGDRNCHGCVADFGSGCGQCNKTYGCDDCTGLLSLVGPHDCLSECPDDQYDLGNGYCGDCDLAFGLSGPGNDTCLNCTVAGCNNAGCDGHLSIDSPKLCLSECPYGQYADGGQCKSCNTEFGVSAQCDNCTLLDGCSNEGCHGLLEYGTPHDCVSSCPIGEFDNEDGTCGDCDTSFSDGATCSECDINGCSTCAGVFSMDSITKCLDQCPYGQYDVAGSCQLCSAFDGEMKCYKCDASGCSNCTGLYSLETPVTCLSECPWNQYADGNDECQSCNTEFGVSAQCDNCTLLDGCSNEGCHGLLKYGTPHDCVSSCPIGEYDNEDGTCGDCDTSFGTGSGVTNAILCDQCTINGCENVGCAGYLSTDVNPVCLSICPTDEYDNQDGTCQPCTDFAPETAVCSECVKATGCFDCTGVLSNTSIHQCLDACEWNEYAFNGQCYSCDASFGITAQCDNCTEATGCSNEGCSGLLSYDSPHFCYNVCPLDEFDNEDGTCGDCDTSFGTGSGVTNAILCDQCTINGCENVGCTGHLSTGPIKYCLSDCQLDEYKHSDGTCHPCNPDFSPDSGATCSTCNTINGCTSCDQLYSMDPIKMCIPTCPSDQYDLTNGNCGNCSDFGNPSTTGESLCNQCSITNGCFNDGCSSVLSLTPIKQCMLSCPSNQFDLNGQCTNCLSTCLTCSVSASNCTECQPTEPARWGPSCEHQCSPQCIQISCATGIGGDGTCQCISTDFCGDQCDKEYDKCDKCGGDGSTCAKDTVQDPFGALGPNGQIVLFGGVGLLVLIILAMAIVIITLRVRMKRKEREKIVAASTGSFIQEMDGSAILESTLPFTNSSTDTAVVFSAEQASLETVDLMDTTPQPTSDLVFADSKTSDIL